MNYYIQGSPAKAKEIKAAFEKNGIDTSANSNYGISNLFYFSCNGEVAVTQSVSIINIIKTHPDYKELELPVQPKFKTGDWIVQNDIGIVSQITKTINGKDEYGEYRAYEHTNGYFHESFEEDYHLWTIADAKDGDVLVSGIDNPFIYNGNIEFPSVGAYIGVSRNGRIRLDIFPSKAWTSIKDVKPATKEQRDLLFAKMKEAGYEWNAEKKELRKIKPHYDIKNFKPYQKVLIRFGNNDTWRADFFSHIKEERGRYFVGIGYANKQCIPFEENEHLLGTTDMCDEQYINW